MELALSMRPDESSESPGTERDTDGLEPSRVGDYVLLDRIALGGMGVVWRARQERVDRTVALKLIRPGILCEPETLARFRIEAEAAAALDHPGIVPIFEIGEHEGHPFFAMKYLPGGNLAETLARGPMSTRTTVRLLHAVAEAVHFAHQHGVVHRDLKPANILLDLQGRPHLTDFGLARRLTVPAEQRITITSSLLGTPAYMAPEVARLGVRHATVASDIWSLGVLLFEMIEGRVPYAGDTPNVVLSRLQSEEPPRLNLPDRDLVTICGKCLEKDPDRRYRTAADLAADLDLWSRDEPILTRPVTDRERVLRWVVRHRALAALISLTIAAILTGVSGIVWQWRIAVKARAAAEHASRQLQKTLLGVRREQAEDAIAKGQSALAIAQLANLVRAFPENAPLGERLVRALETRVFGVPEAPPLQIGSNLNAVILGSRPGQFACTGAGGEFGVRLYADGASLELTDLGDASGRFKLATFSADGNRVALGSSHGEVAVLDALTGRSIEPRTRLPRNVTALALDATGDLGAAAWTENEPGAWRGSGIRVWSIASPSQPARSWPHRHYVGDLRFSPDARYLAVSSTDRTARLLDLSNDGPEIRPLAHGSAVLRAAFSSDSRLLVTVGDDARSVVWSTTDGTPLATNASHQGSITGIAFGPDDSWVATTATDGKTYVWDTLTGTPRFPALSHEAGIDGLALASGGDLLATCGGDATVRLWNLATGEPASAPLRHPHRVKAVAFWPGTRRLSSATDGGAVTTWQLCGRAPAPAPLTHPPDGLGSGLDGSGTEVVLVRSSGLDRHDLRTGHPSRSTTPRHVGWARTALSSDASRVLVRAEDEWTWELWDTHTMRRLAEGIPVIRGIPDPIFSRDASKLVALALDDTFQVYDASTGSTLHSLTGLVTSLDGVFMRLSPDGRWFFADAPTRHGRAIWEVTSGRRLDHPALGKTAAPSACEFSDDSRLLAFADDTGAVELWELDVRPALSVLQHPTPVRTLAFSPDRSRLLTAGDDHSVRVWALPEARLCSSPIRLPGPQSAMRVSSDGRRFLTVGRDHVVRIGSLTEASSLVSLPRHQAAVRFADFTPDGLRAVTVTENGNLRVWETETGHSVSESHDVGTPLRSVQQTREGRHVVTLSDTHGLRLWETGPIREVLPDWFPSFAENLVGLRVTAEGGLDEIPAEQVLRFREDPLAGVSGSAWADWARSFLEPTGTR